MNATAKDKIQGLTNSWYGYAVFGAALSLWNNGIGFFSLLGAAGSFLFSVILTWFIGRRLLAKSSLTRTLLIVITALGSAIGTYGVAKMGYMFFQTWQLSTVLYAGLIAVGVSMHVRSFKVLTDKSVKAYFG